MAVRHKLPPLGVSGISLDRRNRITQLRACIRAPKVALYAGQMPGCDAGSYMCPGPMQQQRALLRASGGEKPTCFKSEIAPPDAAGTILQRNRYTRRDHLIVDFDVEADQIAFAVAYLMVLHAGIPSTPALQLVEEVCHNLHSKSQQPHSVTACLRPGTVRCVQQARW